MKLFLVGGFLGSGKTTAIKNASCKLLKKGTRLGVITNDQGVQLVDSQFIRSLNIPNREVTDGCFCCHYDKLEESIQSLLESDQPEVIFAESVGSCTDLVATIVNPFEKFYPSRQILVSVFADSRILPVLVQEESHFFDDKVHYIYVNQLKEADILVVNKVDLLSDNELNTVKEMIKNSYPDKKVLYQNSLDEGDIEDWIKTLNNHFPLKKRMSLNVDYDIYGEGEAKLGWFDGEIEIQATAKNAIELGFKLIHEIHASICEAGLPIGHLKFFFDDGVRQRKISFTAAHKPELKEIPSDYQSARVNILINARVQTDPDNLRKMIVQAAGHLESRPGCRLVKRKMSAFKPGYPAPTHKMPS